MYNPEVWANFLNLSILIRTSKRRKLYYLLFFLRFQVLGDKATVDQWLSRSNLALGEKSPLELLDTIEGFRLVDDVLAQIEYGFYS